MHKCIQTDRVGQALKEDCGVTGCGGQGGRPQHSHSEQKTKSYLIPENPDPTAADGRHADSELRSQSATALHHKGRPAGGSRLSTEHLYPPRPGYMKLPA
ncbi:hypothetical protein GN956_G5779 [Arapaima gigas]